MGTLPPLNEAQWQDEFQKYQAIPQYRELNRGMSLDAFKTIYWWEWTHRLLGRSIGVVFLLPFLWFLWRGWIGPGLRARLWVIFGLGALQGAVGWWMVASGLADRVEVSQYRLATHLVLACVIYVAILWTAQRLDDRAVRAGAGAHPRRRARASRLGAGADLSRRAGRRLARRSRLQHLAADRRRLRAGRRRACFSTCRCGGISLKTRSRCSSTTACSPTRSWICRAAPRRRCGAHGENRARRRRRLRACGRGDAAGGARHFDAVDGGADLAGADASGDGDARADGRDDPRGALPVRASRVAGAHDRLGARQRLRKTTNPPAPAPDRR